MKKTRQQLIDEFNQLRHDDPDFENMYTQDEFEKWIVDNEIEEVKKLLAKYL